MVTKIISIRLREQELKQIDQPIEQGIFKSRSGAIRELIRLGTENLTYLSEIFKAIEKLSELEKAEGKIPIDFSEATKQLLKEGEKWIT